MSIKAFFFDQDGVIIDTERDGHRVAFNKVFQEYGFPVHWDVETYHSLLKIGGGKERLGYFLQTHGFGRKISAGEEDDLITRLHRRKTEIFIERIQSGRLPLRPGIHRIMKEINTLGLILGVCTTSNQKAAEVITGEILSDIDFDFVLAGDIVGRKKPDPAIYHLALEKCGCSPNDCICIEDSHNGVAAAKGAGLHVVATINGYTESEDLTMADIVVTALGDPGGEKGDIKAGGRGMAHNGVFTAKDLIGYFG